MRRHRAARFAAAVLAALHLIYMWAAAPASAMTILEAADHAELEARIAQGAVTRIALVDDRVKKVIRAPDGVRVEHDAATGDLYLTPARLDEDGEPVGLFVVTERGFTYRLTLSAVDGGSAQILIRNPGATGARADGVRDLRIGVLVALVRAVARREPVAGYAIEGGQGRSAGGLALIETWRGPALEAHVVEVRTVGDAAALAARFPSAAAAWLAAPGTGPSGARLGVVVTHEVPDRSPDQAGAAR